MTIGEAEGQLLLIDSEDSMAAKLVYENKLGEVKDFTDREGIKKTIEYYFNLWKNKSTGYKTDIKNLYNYDRKNLTLKLIEIIQFNIDE